MARVAPIRMANGSRALWFDPGDLEIHKGDAVVVLTARGVEFGEAADELLDVSDEEVKNLKSPLKPVKRLATEEDCQKAAEMARLSAEALPVFKQMAAESGADMRPISVEYLLDGDKAVFYFEAEERVDFRDLVRKLAAHFRVRVDMRQIGVRDEARMVGGLGHCGQELCCKRLGGEFCPVSIRMAKEQDLSLNPQKISGVCGRLMCCLRYEYDAYKDFKSRAPKANATVQTPEGPAKVVDLDVPREVVSLKVGDEKPVKVPLCDFEPAEEGARPNCVCAEAWERATMQGNLPLMGESTFLTSQFTGSDKLAEAGVVRRTGSAKAAPSAKSARGQKGASAADATRKPRRRRSTKVGEGAAGEPAAEGKQAVRGQKQEKQEGGEKQAGSAKRRQRSRGGRSAGQGQQQPQEAQAANKATPKASSKTPSKQGPRPGQRSSALRNRTQGQDAAAGGSAAKARKPQPQPRPAASAASAEGAGGHRRARRRSHKAGGVDQAEQQ